MIIITSKQPGFRRCGVAHPAEPTEYADDAFTPAQIEVLHDEPMLMVLEAGETEVPGDPSAAPPLTKAAEAIASAKAADSIAILESLAEGETRKTVLDAIEARRKELEA